MDSKNQVYVAVGLIYSTILFFSGNILRHLPLDLVITASFNLGKTILGKPSISGLKMGKWVRLTNNKRYLIAFWNDLQLYE